MSTRRSFFLPDNLPSVWPVSIPAQGYLGVSLPADASTQERLTALFPEAVSPESLTHRPGARLLVRAFHAGVTNPMGQSLARALGVHENDVRVDRLVFFEGPAPNEELLQKLGWLWREPAIETLELSNVPAWLMANATLPEPAVRPDDSWTTPTPAEIDLEFEAAELEALALESARRGRAWTRAELEVFAQTWSEHCKHKIFGARIRTPDTEQRETSGLFATHIRKPTLEFMAAHPGRCLSVFEDNAGVMALDTESGASTDWAFCLKMETHNSPSAISPYGGASTGLVGVHRDILGTGRGALPIANWNVLCFEEPGHTRPRPNTALPADIIRRGVIKGIEDGGNQSGVPTVQGSVVFDPAYAVKPLVYAGAVGLLPKKYVDKKPRVGLHLYCVGGSTGADGLRGAVMSSRDLRTSDFRGSAVQVASPFVQRCLTDFLMEARDRDLVDVVTDDGAGGLASSVGEMAKLTGGATIDLSALRLKFRGLHAWERLLSESQERMTVATHDAAAFEALARAWRVDFDRLGVLDDHGSFTVTCDGNSLVDIRLEFLFEGCPRLQLETHWTAAQEEDSLKKSRQARPAAVPNVRQDFARMLASPHLRSREGIVRRFDHEVQGRTLRKPFAGRRQNSAQDGSRLETPEAGLASIVLAHGLSPQREDIVENVVHSFDEALRSAVLAGARLETAGLLDNFCWPDPITRPGSDARTHRRLWRLVRSCETLSRLCRCFDLPLVSGKDSMKNNSADFAALETLVISLGASAESRMLMPTGFFSRANEVVFWIPPEAATLRDSAWERALGVRDANSEVGLQSPSLRSQALDSLADTLRDRYQRLARAIRAGLVRGAKDISEGGLLTAVFEMCLGRDLGFHFEAWDERAQTWFGEGLGGFVFGVDPHLVRAFAELMPEAQRLGVTMNVPVLRWGVGQELALAPLVDAYDGADKGAFWS